VSKETPGRGSNPKEYLRGYFFGLLYGGTVKGQNSSGVLQSFQSTFLGNSIISFYFSESYSAGI
jgi:hypothetical protein